MKRNDRFIIAFLLLAALLALVGFKWYQGNQLGLLIAVISQDNQLIEKIDLNQVSEPREIIIAGKYNEIIMIEKGRIRFKEADCPDKICVYTGWLTEPGDIAVCLPNRAVVKIEVK